MYRIAVVDDEEAAAACVIDKIESYAKRESLDIEISNFRSGEDFLGNDNEKFDIIFLDIEMPGRNGYETAKEIRKTNESVIIIFCTNLVQYAINGYEVSALAFLVKPIQDYSFNLGMAKAIKLISKSQISRIAVKTVHGQIYLSANEIIYIEVQRHNLFFHIKKNGDVEAIKTRGSMTEVCDKLPKENFARCSTSYLINLNHVLSIENNNVELPSVRIPLSRTHKKNFSDTFMRYLVENEVASI